MPHDPPAGPLQVVRLTADGQVYHHPALVHWAHLYGTPGATCTVALYDGFSTSDTRKLTLASTAEGAHDIIFPQPIPFRVGIYADLGAAASELVISFEPQPEL